MAKLKPRARLIRTIGDKLISGPEAAIIELVKNSYDADSPLVRIKICPPKHGFQGTICISDKGHGMSYDHLVNEWLEPATDSKAKGKVSASGERKVLGAKGVGRFASASLGKFIELTSIARHNQVMQRSKLNLDWAVFESHKYLDEIDIDVQHEEAPSSSELGVSIEIKDLSTVWDSRKIQNLIRELRRLATPDHIPNQFEIYLDLEAFSKENEAPYNFDGPQLLFENNRMAEVLQKKSMHVTSSSLIQPYSINEECDYHLEGIFDDKGGFNGTFKIIRGDNLTTKVFNEGPLMDYGEVSCGTIRVDLKIFDLEVESLEKLFSRMDLNFKDFGVRRAREIISENSGVAIYREGFRIRPYGEPDNDWLRLEQRRVNNPSKHIGHRQISGSIHVSSEEESHLVERSSREGLESNSAFERLVNLITNVLIKVENKRFDFRSKAGISRKPVKNLEKAKDIASLENLTKAVQDLPPEKQKPLLLKIEKESKALTKTIEEIEAYQKLLESRAALGMVVAQLLHDGRTYLDPISSYSKSIIDKAPFLLEKSKKGELVREYYPTYGQGILDGAKGLASLFKSLDPISGRRRGRPIEFLAKDTIKKAVNLLEEELISEGVEVVIDADKNISLLGYSGDLQSALMNLLQNAIHWLSVTENNDKKITIKLIESGQLANILISNNGPLIDEGEREAIFEAGFSLKSNGHGLGLSIAREACRNSKGDLSLSNNLIETEFLIEFPLVSEQ